MLIETAQIPAWSSVLAEFLGGKSMNNACGVLSKRGLKRGRRQLCGTGRWLLPLIGVALFLVSTPLIQAQTTAQLTGTVQDSSSAVIPGAQVTLTDQATGITRVVQTNRAGLFAFPSLVPDTYTLKVSAKSFSAKEITGIVLHAGDTLAVPAISLAVADTRPPDRGAWRHRARARDNRAPIGALLRA